MVLTLRLARMQVHHRREPIAMPCGEDAAVEVQALDGDRIDAAQNGPVVPEMVGRKSWDAIETHQHLVIAATPDMRPRAERRARRPRHDLRDPQRVLVETRQRLDVLALHLNGAHAGGLHGIPACVNLDLGQRLGLVHRRRRRFRSRHRRPHHHERPRAQAAQLQTMRR